MNAGYSIPEIVIIFINIQRSSGYRAATNSSNRTNAYGFYYPGKLFLAIIKTRGYIKPIQSDNNAQFLSTPIITPGAAQRASAVQPSHGYPACNIILTRTSRRPYGYRKNRIPLCGQVRHQGEITSPTLTIPAILQTMAAGISSGISPVQFMDSIQVGSQQLANRAFVRWVGELRSRGQDPDIQQVAGSGLQEPGRSLSRQAPLQLMPKKRKKKGELVVVETSGDTPEATPEVPGTEKGSVTECC